MADYTKYTKQEMQAYAIAKNIKDNQIVIVGTGLPLIGASLAKAATEQQGIAETLSSFGF